MDALYHCSDCGQDVTAIEAIGGLRCLHCQSGRLTPLAVEGPSLMVEVVSMPEPISTDAKPTEATRKPRKTHKKAKAK